MKKIVLLCLLIISVFTISACGKKEDKLSDTPVEIETEMTAEPETVPNIVMDEEIKAEREVNALPEVETAPKSEVTPKSEAVSQVLPAPEAETKVVPETKTGTVPESKTKIEEDSSPTKPQSDAESQGIDTITIDHETLISVLENYQETLDALNITVEEISDFLGDEDIVVTEESLKDGTFLQEKLLEYLDTLSLSEKLELLGKLAQLMNE
ncbi:MAG: hypothetical protein IJ282_02945 [Lachnospiraceae bacterium]|nr:hypothetical protein [Lachnospiraceae bacterium]